MQRKWKRRKMKSKCIRTKETTIDEKNKIEGKKPIKTGQ